MEKVVSETAPQSLVVAREPRSFGVSSFLGSLVAIWLGCLAYTVLNIIYPTQCEHHRGSEKFRSSCYAPLVDPSVRVDIRVFAGLPTETNSLSGVLVWELRNHSVYEAYDASFNVPIPEPVRLESQFLNSWVVISPTENVEMDSSLTAEYSMSRRIISSHFLTTLRPLATQSRERDLLSDLDHKADTTTTAPTSSSQTRPADARTMGQHWKYGMYPLTIRYTHYGSRALASPFLSSLSYHLRNRFVRDDNDSPVQEPSESQRRRQPFQLTYEPIVFFDDLSLVRRHLLEMSRDINKPPPKMHIRFAPTSPVHFGFKRVMSLVIDVLGSVMNENEVEEIKYWMSEDRLFRYFLTQVITWLHIILEYLAFRDDWKFFVGRKDFRGISSTSMIFSVIRSVVIFLYLADSDTSMLILFSVGKDVLWSAWKLRRILKPRFYLYRGFIPSFAYLEPCNLNAQEQESAMHDRIATSHVGLCIYPCVAGLAIFSLLNYKYKSWWTWFISSLADSVYFFGFISMTPQLYINYRLKSVAHLPVKAFMYKIFSTFIDDIFAFMVKMPLKHRLMTLRDDIVFFGFLYQCWIYRVDKTRPNEYGFQWETTDENPASLADAQKQCTEVEAEAQTQLSEAQTQASQTALDAEAHVADAQTQRSEAQAPQVEADTLAPEH